MKTVKGVSAIAVLLCSLFVSGFSTTPIQHSFVRGEFVPGEILVKFKPTTSGIMKDATVAAYGGRTLSTLGYRNAWSQIKLAPGQDVQSAVGAYLTDPNVEYAQPNYIYHALALPNDPSYGQQWAFNNTGQTVSTSSYPTNNPGIAGDDMSMQLAWDHITDCSSIVVAVVDTGVNYNQQDLAPNMWNGGTSAPHHGWDFVSSGDNDPMDLNGHGTHVAGIIGAQGNDSTGVTGVCWKASIMAVRVLDATGHGTDAHIISGLEFARQHGAKIVNMSLGGYQQDLAFSDEITTLQNANIIAIIAAGNETNDNDVTPAYPCSYPQPNIVCVAAMDQAFSLASFSNWGATTVDVGAPGTNIISTWAGTETTISDHFNTGGTLNWTTSGGWAYKQLTVSGSGTPVDTLVNPSTFPSGTYANSTDNRVYKTFNLSGNVATLNFYMQAAVQAGDSLNVNYRSAGGDPFVSDVNVRSGNVNTGGFIQGPFSFDISPCIGATCSVGFQLLTDASVVDQGVAILGLDIKTLQLNNTSYNTIDGTSMATPEVTGVAAMVWAYNPNYTYSDVINAIKGGGRAVPALNGITTTGKVVNGMGALAYINPPTGLAVQVK